MRTLRQRVRYFFNSQRYGRMEVRKLIDSITPLGEVAIFGGMLRDLSLGGNANFSSDVDLVIDTHDEASLQKKIRLFNIEPNSFGGYRIRLRQWNVDLWRLSNTWAFRMGYVNGGEFKDLVYTTFFDWDAIVFNIRTKAIYCTDNYLDRLHSGIVDINLESNPNPRGIVARTLQLLLRKHAKLSPVLARYILRNLQYFSVSDIVTEERNSHKRRLLDETFVENVSQQLKIHELTKPDKPFGIGSEQLDLNF